MHKIQKRDLITIMECYADAAVDNEEFIKKIIHLVPFYIFDYDHNQFAAMLKVVTKMNIANKEFYEKYIFPKIEEYIKKFSFSQYCSLLENLAVIGSYEDQVFWHEYILPRIFKFEYNERMAQNVRDSLKVLEDKLPELDVRKYTLVLDNVLEVFENEKSDGEPEKVVVYITANLGLFAKRVEKSTRSMGGKKKKKLLLEGGTEDRI